jgi:membrane protein implicated in regulation of membrane protease activity
MAHSTIWWVLAGLIVTAELVTGTFYLLMISLGMVAAALAAHLGVSLVGQCVVGALVGGGATLAWHFYKIKQPTSAKAEANRDVNQDVGAVVRVDAWNADGSASIKYRGAQWAVLAAPGVAHSAGSFRVREVIGNQLVLEPA